MLSNIKRKPLQQKLFCWHEIKIVSTLFGMKLKLFRHFQKIYNLINISSNVLFNTSKAKDMKKKFCFLYKSIEFITLGTIHNWHLLKFQFFDPLNSYFHQIILFSESNFEGPPSPQWKCLLWMVPLPEVWYFLTTPYGQVQVWVTRNVYVHHSNVIFCGRVGIELF